MASPITPFLEPIERLRDEIAGLEASAPGDRSAAARLRDARRELKATIDSIFSTLTPWQRCQIARHPERPYTLDYIDAIFTGFTQLHGDRRFADDPAIVAGFAMLDGDPVAVVGHQKGRDTNEKLRRNFGMPRPEGYRKAMRIMHLAARFRRPIISFVDTPGAYPGIHAEERGQAEAIADNLAEMSRLPVPIVVVVTGEGGSGGALALGIGDRILMLEHAIYSVISPEGCAAILWKDQSRAEDAAKALRLTANDLKHFGVVDEVLSEPFGGAHMNPRATAEAVGTAIRRHLRQLRKVKADALLTRRYKKYRALGQYSDR
ncbi:MAG TPA: acetyl-CoA carboxylase carboxyltransferase subunit alpha [Thermoanaerobaculales bacterium]|mgnify:CR=1 FL=1|nr:acetyl-CoA carboxylase carboxyltransferase subunit alpha [Thermoanaerobaculales bacterium]HPA81596.1 acetyl-CoA carboxylase carboxyltransferase subunit alpha [Thermoanaerobaculales bacterium]HQL31126.1 acetyl-CoA carboxylase carboxyltransferase subunit alpha [Thermoanaerobaculales bacterium]HQN97501.1 acetyl-CoA carboxylase carboxyltransferase subunit alpha [Thermoanaerobaculales bacterium]